MTAVIDNYIQGRRRGLETLPEVAVGLISYGNGNRARLICFAVRPNIDTIYVRLCAKVVPPHLQAAAAIDSDLQNVHFASPKTVEMTIIDFEVVTPLEDAAPRLAILEES